MSDLTRFRDHCSQMANAEHKPDCPSLTARNPYWPAWNLSPDGHSMDLDPQPDLFGAIAVPPDFPPIYGEAV